ncbi:MobC family plasmid mobilization relaxosome protein [Lachnospiraceae bacterium MD329]|nr:MobC family plasmid mobilization relaxosome protein [Lachnospiraceae bacterium MD329]
MRKRSQAVLIRLTDNEKNHLQRQAANAGLKMEPFIRKLIMGVDITPRPPDNIVNLIREVNYIGNNINQIAKKVNSENSVNQSQLEEIMRLLGEIYREVKN